MSAYFDDRPSAEGFKLRLKHRPDIGEVRDVPALGIVVIVRFIRVMVLWIVVFFVDRAYQEAYVQSVLVEGGGDGEAGDAGHDDGPAPPRLWTLPLAAFAIEAGILLLFSSVLFMLNARFKQSGNAFVVDGTLMRRLASDYAVTTAVMLLLGTAFAAVSQDGRLFRYREDGLRGIRAFSTLFIMVSFAVLGLSPSA